MIKVLKVEFEEEEKEQDPFKYLKGFLMMIAGQIIITWLYNQCQKRRTKESPKKEPVIEEIDDQKDAASNSSEEFEEFELIAHESIEEEAEPKKDQQIIFITRTGYAFHLKRECEHVVQRHSYERIPCEDCAEKTRNTLKKEITKGNRELAKIFITQKDRCYHDPSCEKVWNQRDKSGRVKCLDCQSSEKKDDSDEPSLRRRLKKDSKDSESRSSKG